MKAHNSRILYSLRNPKYHNTGLDRLIIKHLNQNGISYSSLGLKPITGDGKGS